MTKYAKLINNQIQFPPKNKDGIINYNLDVERLIADGYKEFVEVTRPTTNRFYHIEYVNNVNNVAETIVYDETQEEADARELQSAKDAKVTENNSIRDEALNQGVTYKDILFDSDTDQKVNLLATVSMIDDTDTIEWFGMNNDSLICTKQDLLNIGGLITQLHSFCWNKNAEIKEEINNAKTIEEVEGVVIDYEY